MDRRAWIVSLLSAALGIALLRVYLHRFEQEATGGPKTRALVLTRDVAAGAVLERDALGEREFPRAYLESRHVRARALDHVVGGKLAVAGRAGEALLWTDLAGVRGAPRALSTLVPEGMRAVVLAPAQAGLDELLAPGDRVDVLLAAERAGGAAREAELVAENLLVLAVGGDLGGAEGRSGARRGRGVALAATVEQSRRLSMAERAGALRLVVRNPDDLTLAPGADRAAHELPGPERLTGAIGD